MAGEIIDTSTHCQMLLYVDYANMEKEEIATKYKITLTIKESPNHNTLFLAINGYSREPVIKKIIVLGSVIQVRELKWSC